MISNKKMRVFLSRSSYTLNNKAKVNINNISDRYIVLKYKKSPVCLYLLYYYLSIKMLSMRIVQVFHLCMVLELTIRLTLNC